MKVASKRKGGLRTRDICASLGEIVSGRFQAEVDYKLELSLAAVQPLIALIEPRTIGTNRVVVDTSLNKVTP